MSTLPYLLTDGMAESTQTLGNHADDKHNSKTTTNNTTANLSRLVTLTNQQAVFLHMGKAAGGTIFERTRDVWKTRIKECHPRLCPLATQYPNETALIISLRDPIDRWLSAFYWRLYVVCDPDGDHRQVNHGASHDPTKFCKRKPRRDINLLFGSEFHRDANQLAQALCSARNTTLQTLARQTMQQVHHAQIWITDWLDNFAWQPNDMFALVVVAQQHGEATKIDLEPQIDAAMEWLYKRTRFESQAAFAVRRQGVQQSDKILVQGKFTHSAGKTKQPLSLQAEQCLAQWYRKDYELLQDKKHLLCKTDECLAGIQSILDRRSHLLSWNTTTATATLVS